MSEFTKFKKIRKETEPYTFMTVEEMAEKLGKNVNIQFDPVYLNKKEWFDITFESEIFKNLCYITREKIPFTERYYHFVSQITSDFSKIIPDIGQFDTFEEAFEFAKKKRRKNTHL